MSEQTIRNIEKLLPQLPKLCDHNVAGMPLGTMCACTAISQLVVRLKAENKKPTPAGKHGL